MGATLALAAALIWLILANLLAMMPSPDHHWTNAYRLIAVGVPLLVWLVVSNGLIWGGIFLIAAGSVLRWPVIYAWRWLRRRALDNSD